MKPKTRFLGAAGLLLGLATGTAAAVPANASTPVRASAGLTLQLPGKWPGDWAGWYSEGKASTPIDDISVSLTVPTVDKNHSWGLFPRSAALWAGIGGMEPGHSLAQAGVWMQQDRPNAPVKYWLFWELVNDKGEGPEQPMTVGEFSDQRDPVKPGSKPIYVKPGHTVEISVSRTIDTWAFVVGDVTTSQWGQHSEFGASQGYDDSNVHVSNTAEVITEWTSITGGNLKPGQRGGLLNMGDVHYDNVRYLTDDPSAPGGVGCDFPGCPVPKKYTFAVISSKVLGAGPFFRGVILPSRVSGKDGESFSTYIRGW